jgi:hypothetical protein
LVIGQVQEHLEAIYGLRCELRAEQFLLHDEETARQLGFTGRAREELLLAEDAAGDVEIGLFLAPDLLSRLTALSPGAALEHELPAYCEVAEGVSHFLYFVHSASQGRKVSMLELEVQAEIDKFATCALLRWEGSADAWAQQLLGRLFQRVQYREQLTAPERWRYQEANRISAAYCRRVARLISTRRMDRVLNELRYAYRLGAEAKLAYLTR